MAKTRAGTMLGSYSGRLSNPHWHNGRRVIYLRVPFAENAVAKAAGARFNPDKRQWWVYADIDDRSPFAAWLPPNETVGQKVVRRGRPLSAAERQLQARMERPD
jgi:hypothetical protein